MKIDTVIAELGFHCGRNENVNNPKWKSGFLGSLRPFQTMELVEANFHDVVRLLRPLVSYIKNNKSLGKQLVSSVSNIISLGRAWAVGEDGMLRRNNLISECQACQIEEWIDCISYIWATMLDTEDEETSFEVYDLQYKNIHS